MTLAKISTTLEFTVTLEFFSRFLIRDQTPSLGSGESMSSKKHNI